MRRKITAAFLLAFFLLVGAEVVVRVFFARNMAGRFEYGYHPDAGFVEEGDTLKLVRAGGRRFFPQSLKINPEPGTFRIFIIGDSVPRGPNLEQAYAHQLQEDLQAQGIKAEAYNLCVPGYGTQRKHIVLAKALEYHPSLLILHMNASNEYEDEREYKRSQEFAGWHPKNWLMKSLVIRRLYEAKTEKGLWYLLPTEVRMQAAINDADAEIAAGQNEATLQRWNEQVRHWTATSIQSAKARQVPILLVAHASCEDMKDPAKPLDDQGLDALAESFNSPGVYHFSMKEALTGGDYAALYADGSHMRAAGHKVMADALAAFITTNGLVKAEK
jgi:hypothetical protein